MQRINQECFKNDPVLVFPAYNPFSVCGLWRSSLFLPPLFLSSFLFFPWEIGCCQTPTSFFGKVGKERGKKCSLAFFFSWPWTFLLLSPASNSQFPILLPFFLRRTVGKKRALLQFQIDFVSLGKTGLGNGALVSILFKVFFDILLSRICSFKI